MKIKVQRVEKHIEEVEVALPFYRYHDVSGDRCTSEIFTKVSEIDGKAVALSIHRKDSGWDLEVEPFREDGSGADYTLGRGVHSLTEAEFEAARRELIEWLTRNRLIP